MNQIEREGAIRRTFAIISHPDAGKTTMTEKLLLFGNAISVAGTVKARKAAPHLIPCVEICPGPNTSEKTIEKAKEIFNNSGSSIVNVKKEVDGFILNRLQGALLNEAMRLYSEGYANSDEIDATIRDGLGLRWAFMGPFETIDLNAPGGIRDYMSRYGSIYTEMAKNQTQFPDWSDKMGEKLEIERRKILPKNQLEQRAKKRNLLLKSLRKVKIENGEV